MKKVLLCLMTLTAVVMISSCQKEKVSDGVCRISGTVTGEQYEGKRIFLVPLNGPSTAEYVDSVVVKDGKFEFVADSFQIYKVLLDYHYRMGLQPIIIVGEPGNVWVKVGEVSYSGGTPQNDSLQHWKVLTEVYRKQTGDLRKNMVERKRMGDNALAEQLQLRIDSLRDGYKMATRRMADNLGEGPLHDFLAGLFPMTYQKKKADGTLVTVNADTNEEVESEEVMSEE